MSAKRKAFTVRGELMSLRVVPHAKGWRFGYREGDGWRYVTRRKRSEIVEAAEDHLEGREAGFCWSALPRRRLRFLERVHGATGGAEDERAVLAFLEARADSQEIRAGVKRWSMFKETVAGEVTPHHKRERAIVVAMAEHFAGRRVVEVSAGELLAWWTGRGKGLSAKRRKDLRAALVGFWRWAQREKMTGDDPVTVAERLPAVKVPKPDKRVLEVGELLALLNGVPERFRAWVVLQAFAGLRPEEAAPSKRESRVGKRGLRCEEIDWDFRVIRLPAEVSKVNDARLVPFNDALELGLRWAGIGPGMTGAACLANPTDERLTAVWGRELLHGTWPKDALRHSYGSYRNAVTRNLPALMEEMGTSMAMLRRHYHNPQAREAGLEWFGVFLKSSEIGGVEVWFHPSCLDEESPEIKEKAQ